MSDPSEPPRYSAKPFPPYRFIPGRSPHPRRDPRGHSHGQPEPKASPLTKENWKTCELYLYGIDLFNHSYWWDCHEALEALWHASGHETPVGQFLQGIIQVAAAHLQRFAGSEETARELAERGLARHRDLSGIYMGVDIGAFNRTVRQSFEKPGGSAVSISLSGL